MWSTKANIRSTKVSKGQQRPTWSTKANMGKRRENVTKVYESCKQSVYFTSVSLTCVYVYHFDCLRNPNANQTRKNESSCRHLTTLRFGGHEAVRLCHDFRNGAIRTSSWRDAFEITLHLDHDGAGIVHIRHLLHVYTPYDCIDVWPPSFLLMACLIDWFRPFGASHSHRHVVCDALSQCKLRMSGRLEFETIHIGNWSRNTRGPRSSGVL